MNKPLYFVVNEATMKIEKVYTGAGYCNNYIMKKDYPLAMYKITDTSDKYNKVKHLIEGDTFPSLIF